MAIRSMVWVSTQTVNIRLATRVGWMDITDLTNGKWSVVADLPDSLGPMCRAVAEGSQIGPLIDAILEMPRDNVRIRLGRREEWFGLLERFAAEMPSGCNTTSEHWWEETHGDQGKRAEAG